jgi:hypothetical protein
MSERFSRLAQTYNNSVLVSTAMGNLLRLYCPIMATARIPVAHIGAKQQVRVTAIYETTDFQLLYEVDGNMYPHHYFELLNHKTKTT